MVYRHLAAPFLVAASAVAPAFFPPAERPSTTPIKHVIVVVGENHTFDNVFATYVPKAGQTVDNLLSKGIITATGAPGPNFSLGRQRIGSNGTGAPVQYRAETASVAAYAALPQPYTKGALGQPASALDERFPADMPNGPFQITKYVPYLAYTGDPAHGFFQMWQQVDAGRNDKFVWVAATIGGGSNGAPYPSEGFNPKEGALSMGFYNMNPYRDASGIDHPGDAAFFKRLADGYAMSDNYHQSVMGGSGANFQMLVAGDVAFYTSPTRLDGSPAAPPAYQIEDPNPAPGSTNYYLKDGAASGAYVACGDPTRPGVAGIDAVLRRYAISRNNCAAGRHYAVNNRTLYWNQTSAKPRAVGPTSTVLPPQGNPTIADVMTANGVSWKFYSGDRGDDVTKFSTEVDGVPLAFHNYCGLCDPLTAYSRIMRTPTEEAKLQNYGAFLRDVAAGSLPAVSYVRPFLALGGHPAISHAGLYEQFLSRLIARVQANRSLWATTAIIVTFDEGGGYYDSGYVQPIDFFGDGSRVPFIVVSPWARRGYVDHTYADHASILKFIERNWSLPKISSRSRDNLPNPVTNAADPYRPRNRPAIGDLMKLFSFGG